MPIDVNLPALSPTMTEATISKWHVAEGEQVAAGQVIADIETDKTVLELESPVDGVVLQINVPAGSEEVDVGAIIAVIGEIAGAVSHAETLTQSNTIATKAPPLGSHGSLNPSHRIKSSPSARMLASEHQIDIATLVGSGPGGRIVKCDVQNAVDQIANAPELAPALSAPVAAPRTDTAASSAASGDDSPKRTSASLGTTGTAQNTKTTQEPSYEDHPLTSMRKSIAKNLQYSKQTIPHFCLETDVVANQLLSFRKALNERSQGDKLSINDFIVRACACALAKFPEINVAFVDGMVRSYRSVDVSIAVAVDGGLVTPVVKNANALAITALSSTLKKLVGEARQAKLLPEDYQGGSMTISNLGATGVKSFYAVINPPQASILAVGACEKRAIVEEDSLVVRHVISLSLSCDHRVIDGQQGGEFLLYIKKLLENPVLLLDQ